MPDIRCNRCGKNYVSSYDSCPWCGSRPVSNAPAAKAQPRIRSTPPPPAAVPPAPPRRQEPRLSFADEPAPHARANDAPVWTARANGAVRWAIRHPRTSALSIAVLVLAWWFLAYLPATPSWALWSFYDAARGHQGELAASYVDFESITRNLLDEAFKSEVAKNSTAGKNDPATMMGEALGKGIGSLMAGPISQTLKVRFERDISDSSKDPQLHASELIGAIWRMHREGDSAVTSGIDDKGQKVELTMTRVDGRWRITRLDGDAIRKQVEDAVRNRGPAEPPGSGADL